MKARPKDLPCISNRRETQRKIITTDANQVLHLLLSRASHNTKSQYFKVICRRESQINTILKKWANDYSLCFTRKKVNKVATVLDFS